MTQKPIQSSTSSTHLHIFPNSSHPSGELDKSLISAIVEASDDAIISKTLDGIITTWNASAERMFGYSAEEIIGKPKTILFPSDRLQEEKAILEGLRLGIPIDHFETIRLHKNGTSIEVSVTISPIKDAEGQIVAASAIIRDITLRKQAERGQSLLSAIVEASDDAIISKTLDGIITTWNASAERMFGYSAEEIIGKPKTTIFPLDRLDEEKDILDRLRQGIITDHFETLRLHKNGTLIEVR